MLNYPQPNISKSFGGYISSSSVPTSELQNIFASISALELQSGQLTQVVALFLKNTLSVPTTSTVIYHGPLSDQKYSLQLGVQNPASGQISSYGNIYNVPRDVTFQDFVYDPDNSIDERISLGPLAVGATLGLFFKRIIVNANQDSWQKLYDDFTVLQALKKRYDDGDNTLTSDELKLISQRVPIRSIELTIDYAT